MRREIYHSLDLWNHKIQFLRWSLPPSHSVRTKLPSGSFIITRTPRRRRLSNIIDVCRGQGCGVRCTKQFTKATERARDKNPYNQFPGEDTTVKTWHEVDTAEENDRSKWSTIRAREGNDWMRLSILHFVSAVQLSAWNEYVSSTIASQLRPCMYI